MDKQGANNPRQTLPSTSFWHLALACVGGVAVLAHFALRVADLAPLGAVAVADMPLLFIVGLGGAPLVLQILWKFARGDFGADLLAAVALATGAALGEYLAAALIVLMLAGGRALEAYALRRASSALRVLSARMPRLAHRKRGELVEDIALAAIALGDEVVVFPHETAPVDGTVVSGNGAMDESYLTGEPYRVSKAPGVPVLSGAINGESVLVIRAEKLPQDSRYAQIMAVMQEAEQRRPAMRRLGDQIGAVFAPLALLGAAAAWYATGDATRFLAVLVVATPCPLLIAIPITLISAIAMAARRGIVIKDPTVLERLPTCRTAIFDKTGTLTYGRPELTEIIPAAGFAKDEVLRRAASLERYSKHPLAQAVLDAAEKASLAPIEAASVSEKAGQGLVGMIGGQEIRVTHRRKLLQTAPEVAALLPPSVAGLECIVMIDGHYAAALRFRDAPRADGKSFIGHLAPSHQFNKVMLVSGDRESEVAYLAAMLGIKDTLSSQSPEQKVAIVRAETARAPTLFMGDGINDAPALASATVGIAFGQHSAVTAEAAGAVILESALAKVDELIHISMAMRSIVLQSAIGGMALSVVAMGFAAGGFITPVAGAVLQEAIDVLAILNALRLGWGHRVAIDLNRAGGRR